MAQIAVVRVHSPYEAGWDASGGVRRFYHLLAGKGSNGQAGKSADQIVPQLTLPYLVALGEIASKNLQLDNKFHFFDGPASKLTPLLLEGYDLVLFTVHTGNALPSYQVSDVLRRKNIPTAMGGIHVSAQADEAEKHADCVVIGEAETIMETLLRDFAQGALKPRYRGPLTAKLADLPTPVWQSSPITPDYAPLIVPVQTSRGCCNACSFCSTTRFQGARRRHRPVGEIVDEIRMLQDQGVLTSGKSIFFTDNNIVSDTDHRRGVVNHDYARSLFEALIPLNIIWSGQGELDVTNHPDLLGLMAASGCLQLLVGLESLDERNLQLSGKPCNQTELYAEQIDMLHRYGVGIIGCFMFGQDHDTEETFEKAEAFIERYVDVPQVSLFTPLPGTQLYRKMEKEGRLLHRDWSLYDILHVTVRPKGMSAEDLERRFQRLAQEINTPWRSFRRGIKHALRQPLPGTSPLSGMVRFTCTTATCLGYRLLYKEACRPSFTEACA